MNFTLRLTLDGLVGALRMKAHSLADGVGTRRPAQSPRSADKQHKAGAKTPPRKARKSNDLSRR